MLLGEPLDGAEKRRSKGTVRRCTNRPEGEDE